MPKPTSDPLSRRERQIMDVIYRRSRATAAEVAEGLHDAPSNSAVRALLAILVNKGVLKIEEDGPRYVYRPTRPRAEAGRTAIQRVLETFFDGSVENAVTALLEGKGTKLSREELDRLNALIEQARQRGR